MRNTVFGETPSQRDRLMVFAVEQRVLLVVHHDVKQILERQFSDVQFRARGWPELNWEVADAVAIFHGQSVRADFLVGRCGWMRVSFGCG